MGTENVNAQMRKGILEYCILCVLSDGDAYASDIIGRLKEARMIVVEGTLYPLLTRLKNAGLLAYRWEESTQGPPRKYYFISETGKRFLEDLDASWEELVKSVQYLRNNRKK
jgi:PadR family transcriptional regulator PadR